MDILLVDDEPKVREFLARALTQKGFACRMASGSEQALAEVSKRTPRLVITDLRMAGRDGSWLLRELKRRWPELPVIMLTADGEARTAVQCLKDGADDYLVKPVDVEELGIATRRAVERTRLLEETRVQREHLAIAETQKQRLREAFDVLESTYRDALGALLRAESLERSAARSPNRSDTPGSEPSPSGSFESRSTLGMEAGTEIELSGLRLAGKLIGDGVPFGEVGTAVANELVEHYELASVRVWTLSEAEAEPKLLVEAGSASPPGQDLAKLSVSSAKIERADSNGVTSVSCPILLNGTPRAVLQLVAPIQTDANLAQAAERLSLVLSASLARELDARERRRTVEELDLLYGLASASRYSLELEPVAEFLLESLERVVDYDVAGLLLVDEAPSLIIQTRFPADEAFARRVREHVLTNLKLTCGIEPPADLVLRVRGLESTKTCVAPAKLRSFVNVPLTVGGSIAGLLYLSSGRDRAFTDEGVRFLHRVANFLATSVQGVRELVGAVKGRIEQMVEHMSDGVLMLDRRGNVVAMNAAARDALNCREGGERPMNASSLARVLDFDPLELLKTRRRSFRKVVCVRGVPYQAQLSPVVGENGDTIGAVLAFRNFEQEQKLDEMKSDLVNVVSHELRTPLTAIKNALSLLDGPRLGTLGEKQQHFVHLAQRNVGQLVGIINDLLDLSKLEAGKMPIELESLSLDEPIAAASSSLEAQAETKGVSLQTSIERDLPRVHGDAAAIQRVLVNLIGNALKFTEAGGRISVAAAKVADEASCASGAAVRVTVSDSGVGIPEDQLDSIFDKFHQVAGGNRHTTTVGTGLGLPICRELVKAHHGRIWAESTEGSGSRFSFALPLFSDQELLLRCLDTDIARARTEGMSLVVMVLTVREDPRLPDEHRPGNRRERLELVREAAKNVTRRSGDRVFVIENKNQVAIILPRTPGDGGTAFAERLGDELRKANGDEPRFFLRVGSSTFPDDGDSADSLYTRAEAALKEESSSLV